MVDLPQPDGAENMKQCPILVLTSALKCGLETVDTWIVCSRNHRLNATQYFVLARAFGPHKLLNR